MPGTVGVQRGLDGDRLRQDGGDHVRSGDGVERVGRHEQVGADALRESGRRLALHGAAQRRSQPRVCQAALGGQEGGDGAGHRRGCDDELAAERALRVRQLAGRATYRAWSVGIGAFRGTPGRRLPRAQCHYAGGGVEREVERHAWHARHLGELEGGRRELAAEAVAPGERGARQAVLRTRRAGELEARHEGARGARLQARGRRHLGRDPKLLALPREPEGRLQRAGELCRQGPEPTALLQHQGPAERAAHPGRQVAVQLGVVGAQPKPAGVAHDLVAHVDAGAFQHEVGARSRARESGAQRLLVRLRGRRNELDVRAVARSAQQIDVGVRRHPPVRPVLFGQHGRELGGGRVEGDGQVGGRAADRHGPRARGRVDDGGAHRQAGEVREDRGRLARGARRERGAVLAPPVGRRGREGAAEAPCAVRAPHVKAFAAEGEVAGELLPGEVEVPGERLHADRPEREVGQRAGAPGTGQVDHDARERADGEVHGRGRLAAPGPQGQGASAAHG